MQTEMPKPEDLESVRADFVARSRSTRATNRSLVKEAAAMAYKEAKLAAPTVHFVKDHLEGLEFAIKCIEAKGLIPTVNNITNALWVCQYGLSWLAHYHYFRKFMPKVPGPERLIGLETIATECFAAFLFGQHMIAVDRPVLNEYQPEPPFKSNTEKHCFEWRSGRKMYFISDIQIDEERFLRPTVDHIREETNAEVRRVLLRKYGTARFVREVGLKPAQKDLRGALYRMTQQGDEDLVMVRFVNRTKEARRETCPDCGESGKEKVKFQIEQEVYSGTFCKCGSHVLTPKDGVFKTYWFRVSPNCQTATAAYEEQKGLSGIHYILMGES